MRLGRGRTPGALGCAWGTSCGKHWRKSSQWFALTRKHAELVMQDTELLHIFQQHCQNAWDNDLNRRASRSLPMMQTAWDLLLPVSIATPAYTDMLASVCVLA